MGSLFCVVRAQGATVLFRHIAPHLPAASDSRRVAAAATEVLAGVGGRTVHRVARSLAGSAFSSSVAAEAAVAEDPDGFELIEREVEGN